MSQDTQEELPARPDSVSSTLLCQLDNEFRIAIIEGASTPRDLHYFVGLQNVLRASLNIFGRSHSHNGNCSVISMLCERPGSYTSDEFYGSQAIIGDKHAAVHRHIYLSICCLIVKEEKKSCAVPSVT